MSYRLYKHSDDESTNIGLNSIFSWSGVVQTNISTTNFQYVTFEKPLIGPIGSGWITLKSIGYIDPTIFVVPTSGYYLLTYKMDIMSGNNTSLTINSNSVAVVTLNGVEIPGSTSLVEAPETNHIYTISNTVLAQLNTGDLVSLLFWSPYVGTQIGDPSLVTGILPNGSVPNEATASISITKISN